MATQQIEALPPDRAEGAPGGGLRAWVHRYLEETPTTLGPRIVQFTIMLTIIASITAIIVGTLNVKVNGEVKLLEDAHEGLFFAVEAVCVVIFSAEYLLRLWSCTVDPRFAAPLAGRLRFATTAMALVDLLAILPFYLQVTGLISPMGGLLVVRALRLLRVFRIFKLGRYSVAVRTLSNVFYMKKAELGVALFGIVILLVLASTIIFFAEHDAQPEKYTSIPASMWWAIVTLTTVGYGDISPITPLGQLTAGFIAVLGIGVVALPAAILGSAYIEMTSTKSPKRCPHCGKDL
jgi:voltage-gated potassium channel